MQRGAATAQQTGLFDSPETVGPDSIKTSRIPAVNVASVPQRSPLRYPGGKTWLIPHVRIWLRELNPGVRLLVEPFTGGGVVSLTAVMEGLAEQCLMAELDRDVAAFWEASLRHGAELCNMIANFQLTREAALEASLQSPHDAVQRGFRTLILNRTRRSGILAPGASLNRAGENGKGIASRWYPETIIKRLREIAKRADRIDFREMDGMELLEETLSGHGSDAAFFVDPPYTAGGKRAGKRLYAHNAIDHPQLFAMLADSGARFLMTYDRAPEIESLIRRHGFHAVQVFMKNAHHNRIPELVITPQPAFLC